MDFVKMGRNARLNEQFPKPAQDKAFMRAVAGMNASAMDAAGQAWRKGWVAEDKEFHGGAGVLVSNGQSGVFVAHTASGHKYLVASAWASCGQKCNCQGFKFHGKCKHVNAANRKYAQAVAARMVKNPGHDEPFNFLLRKACQGVSPADLPKWEAFWSAIK